MKKSFILHYDSLDVLDVITDDQCGKLLKKMRSYHNWNEYESNDKLVDAVFMQFKNQFDRDKEKYEVVCDKNKENVRKRWDKKYTTVYDRIRSDTKNTDNDNDNVNDIIYNKEDIQFNEDEKEIIKTFELWFNKLEDIEYRHKLNLLIQLLTTSGQVSFTNWWLVSYENEEWQIMNKIEKVQVIDYKVAKIKAIEVVSAKERYKVKDFWATLNNRIKKDLSPKKFN